MTRAIGPNELPDKRTLVTGGTKGMGAAIVTRLRQAGARVITAARSKPANIDLPDLFIAADLSTRDGVQKVVEARRRNCSNVVCSRTTSFYDDQTTSGY